jgi:hypothetical protein
MNGECVCIKTCKSYISTGVHSRREQISNCFTHFIHSTTTTKQTSPTIHWDHKLNHIGAEHPVTHSETLLLVFILK